MTFLDRATRLTASVAFLALAAACSSGGGNSYGGGGSSGATGATGSTGSTGGTTTVPNVSIGAPDRVGIASAPNLLIDYQVTPPTGHAFSLAGSAVALTPTTVSATGFTTAQTVTATWRGTTTDSSGRVVPIVDLNIPALGVTALNVRGDGTSATPASGGQVNFVGGVLHYSLLGYWGYIPPSGGIVAYSGIGVSGSGTPASGMPTTGSATYSKGLVLGSYYIPDGNGSIALGTLTGNASLTANFGTGAVNGALSGMTAQSATSSSSPATPWNSLTLSGSINGTTFAGGTVTTAGAPAGAGTAGFSASASGGFAGAFYGPNADEMGLTWTLTDPTAAGGGKTAFGAAILGK